MKPISLAIIVRSLRARLIPSAALVGVLLLAACAPQSSTIAFPLLPTATPEQAVETATAYPTRPVYAPGTLVDYTAQSGDTLLNLAARFNTTPSEILAANSFIPQDATTMPPGMPMKMPIYYQPLWGSPYQILPDGHFINGPHQVGFDTAAYVNSMPGWLKDYRAYIGDRQQNGGEMVAYVAMEYSISPRLLLAVLEYQSGALSQPEMPAEVTEYLLGYENNMYAGLESQILWAADTLNDGYYRWRGGKLTAFDHLDGRLERPDPWQNAATVALQYYFSRMLDGSEYDRAIGSQGFYQTYTALFGDPWAEPADPIPGSLKQPEMQLPFNPGLAWAFTGGPHTGYGTLQPWAALDFAPPTEGCAISGEWAVAVADGVISRMDGASLMLDLDGDGDEHTGWNVYYLHLAGIRSLPVGTAVKAGDLLGHPSCEGGRATGSHVHIARKYNGEWILAEGTLAFNLQGWVAYNGAEAYQGKLMRYGKTITASTKSDSGSIISADPH